VRQRRRVLTLKSMLNVHIVMRAILTKSRI
jgi:hypothetical protein